MTFRDQLFLANEFVRATGPERLEVVSPLTDDVIGQVVLPTPEELDRAVIAARTAFDAGPWPQLTVLERAQALRRVTEAFAGRVAEATTLQIDEMGGTATFIGATTTGLGPFLERVIADAEYVPMLEERQGAAGPVRVLREPIGVVAAVVPWNAPLMAAATKLFPALLMGCPVLLKTAPESPLSAHLLAEAFAEADLPAGVASIFPGGGEVGRYLVDHQGVDMVTFTGSTGVGRDIAASCGRRLKPVTLELGGKSAAILTPGLDLDAHLDSLIGNAFGNCGQKCVATTRVLVHESQRDDLRDALVHRLRQMKVGNPHEPDTDFGPLVSARQLGRVTGYVQAGLAEGATLVYGGDRPDDLPVGCYLNPTVFTDVANDMTIAREEIFGPVLSVISYGSEDDAVAIANDSNYGLGGAVYADDPEHAYLLASRLQTGTCSINNAPPSGGGGPFGGYKDSGLGRERGPEGLSHFLQLKSITLPPRSSRTTRTQVQKTASTNGRVQ